MSHDSILYMHMHGIYTCVTIVAPFISNILFNFLFRDEKQFAVEANVLCKLMTSIFKKKNDVEHV